MNKKRLNGILCLAVCASLALTGCNGSSGGNDTPTDTEASPAAATGDAGAAETEKKEDEPAAPAATASEIPQDYKYYFSFDEPDDRVHSAVQDKAATPIVQVSDDAPEYVNGVKGNALYVNGARGAKLDVNGVGDTYTVSFWVRAERSANYMPTLQYGPDMHGDATGGQHYVNFTWADWNPDGSAYPCVWAYDELDGAKWPNWYPDEANTHVSEWCNVTMTVDPNDLSDDGTLIKAHLYFNGEELVGYDSDKNVRPTLVVSNTMAPSDNFDFLLGINYWDAIMKGAFDEVYVYDYVLDAGQIKALYEAGDPTAKYEAPSREVVVTANPAAIESIGTTDLSMNFWSDWTSTTELKDGDTKIVKLKNWSDGVNLYDNYAVIFSNTASDAHVDPNSIDGHKEYAVVRADAYGWLDGNGDNAIDAALFTYNWGNWPTWLSQVMTEASVELKISRNGSDISITATNTDYLGSANVASVTFPISAAAGDPCYFNLTGEKCYIDILSIADDIRIEADPAAIDHIGNTDLSAGFWSDFSEAIEIKNGATETIKFKHYGSGIENWHNYVLAFTNGYSEAHKAPADAVGEGYMEYIVLRADNYQWGTDVDAGNAVEYEAGWTDWDLWKETMKAAEVTLTITRDGTSMVINETIKGDNGTDLTNKRVWTTTAAESDPMYMVMTLEQAYVDILSIE